MIKSIFTKQNEELIKRRLSKGGPGSGIYDRQSKGGQDKDISALPASVKQTISDANTKKESSDSKAKEIVRDGGQEEIKGRMSELFNQLVEPTGPSKTVEGELVRAANRIGYRDSNDGDVFWEGYGVETAGSSAVYLEQMADTLKIPGLKEALNNAEGKSDEAYTNALMDVNKSVIDYVDSKGGKYTPNTDDIHADKYSKSAMSRWNSKAGYEDEDEEER